MINIDTKPHKRTEYFYGSITMALPHTDRTSWKFELLRMTNGTVSYDVNLIREVSDEPLHPEAEHLLIKTVIANLQKEQVKWTPQEKEAKP
jgi:hypothetical protein